jgi:hypothetical protein
MPATARKAGTATIHDDKRVTRGIRRPKNIALVQVAKGPRKSEIIVASDRGYPKMAVAKDSELKITVARDPVKPEIAVAKDPKTLEITSPRYCGVPKRTAARDAKKLKMILSTTLIRDSG